VLKEAGKPIHAHAGKQVRAIERLRCAQDTASFRSKSSL
jgi:hypothetical protein